METKWHDAGEMPEKEGVYLVETIYGARKLAQFTFGDLWGKMGRVIRCWTEPPEGEE